jgi:hypothetical protein
LEEADNVEVVVWPNPASGVVNVKGHHEWCPHRLVLMTTDGKVIREAEGDVMQLEGVAEGVYLLGIEAGGGNVVRKVVVRAL